MQFQSCLYKNGMSSVGGLGRFFETARTAYYFFGVLGQAVHQAVSKKRPKPPIAMLDILVSSFNTESHFCIFVNNITTTITRGLGWVFSISTDHCDYCNYKKPVLLILLFEG
jgi:hypothetical protein